MIRAFFLIVVTGAAALSLIWATQTFTGNIVIPLGKDVVVEVNIVFAAVGLIIAGGLIAVLWGILAKLYNLPSKFSRGRKKKADIRAESALTEGLLAAEAGDSEAAVQLAQKAHGGKTDERLQTMLLARAAEASSRWNEAEAHWARLASMPGGQLAGLRGAATAAAERGDDKAAEDRTRSALHLNSGADWPFHSLFDFQVARADWQGALETLAIGKKRKLLDEDHTRRRLAVLLTAKSHAQLKSGDARLVANHLSDAAKLAPEFPPAIYFSALNFINAEKYKQAKSVLQMGWKARPHPAIVQMWQQASTPQPNKASDISALIAENPNHVESRLLLAEEALQKSDFQKAVSILEPLEQTAYNARLCQFLAQAYDGLNKEDIAQNWRVLADTAATDADWSDLSPNGTAFDFSNDDWARLVYEFGDRGELIHTRHETFQKTLTIPQIVKRLEVNSERSEAGTQGENAIIEEAAPKTWTD